MGMRIAAGLFVIVTTGLVVGKLAGWLPFAWLEIVGSVTGAACVLLAVNRNIWNFPIGIVSAAAYLVFFAQGQVYALAGLQVVVILLNGHGWLTWALGQTEETPTRRVPLGEMTILAVTFPAIWIGLTRLLEHFGGASASTDAFVTALSLAAQWLLNRRYLETWLVWIVVDQVSVILFWSNGMYLSAGLYTLFLAMCVAGFIEWRRELVEPKA